MSFDDLLGLAQRYGLNWSLQQDASPFGSAELDLLGAYSIVLPEPTSLMLVASAVLLRRHISSRATASNKAKIDRGRASCPLGRCSAREGVKWRMQ